MLVEQTRLRHPLLVSQQVVSTSRAVALRSAGAAASIDEPAADARKVACPPTVLLVCCSMLVGLLAAEVGLVKSLPYQPEADESVFVESAMHIARKGDLNPHWLGHPGATVIYPLAIAFRVLDASGLRARAAFGPSALYLVGRELSAVYEVLSLPLVFVVGRRVFGSTAGLIATWLLAILPIAVAHSQVVRTDSAAVFFGLLALWLELRISDGPERKRLALAGIAVGVAIATRYFMVALVPLLLGFTLVADRRRVDGLRGRALRIGLACTAVVVGFALTSPYSLLDPAELQRSLRAENEPTHLGADGLSPVGNMLWYVTGALPADMTWPAAGLALLGILLALRARHPDRVLLLGYVAVFLVIISSSALHWHRWIIQLLPILALYGAYALQTLMQAAPAPLLVGPAMLALVSIQPAYQLVTYDLQQIATPPQIRARDWIVANVPKRTRLAVEGYGPSLAGLGYADTTIFTLAEPGGPEDYAARGYRYLVVSSAVYGRYLAEPDRYASQRAFYTELFTHGQLMAEFDSPVLGSGLFGLIAGGECNCALYPYNGGLTIRIYAIQPSS